MNFLTQSNQVTYSANEQSSKAPIDWMSVKGLLLLVFLVPATYLFFTRGYQSKHVKSVGQFSSRTANGMTLGGTSLFALKGQKIKVKYNVTEIKRGRLMVRVINSLHPMNSKYSRSRYTSSKGPGRFEMTVPETGFYKIKTDGSTIGYGYDVKYTASWSVF